MPWYNELRPDTDEKKKKYSLIFSNLSEEEQKLWEDEGKKRCIQNILILRDALQKSIPNKITDQNILMASWNIKEFGHTDQRLPESYFYIAEIINKFDLVAIQEIKSSLDDLNIIMRILGSDWDYIVNDITEGKKGNSERSAYLYNNKRVQLAGIAGEISLHEKLTKNSDIKQLKRSPYITGFSSGWKKFSLINLHLHPNKKRSDIEYRREEVRLLIKAVKEKVKNRRFWNENLILVGDFNFYNDTSRTERDGPTIKMLNDAGFRELGSLSGIDTNASKTEAFDRLFFMVNNYFKIRKDENGNEIGNVFDPFLHIFTDESFLIYKQDMLADYGGNKDLEEGDNLEKYYLNPWRKNQISDHFPVWVEIITDSSDDFLQSKLKAFDREEID